jgi:hypothetical protein
MLLGFTLSCSSSDGGAPSGDALELRPRSTAACKTYDCDESPGDGYCDDWQGGDLADCKLDCPRGGSTGPIAVHFECTEVHVVSCKDLSNVVVEFADGEHVKFDGLNGHYGTFGAGDRVIVGVWVKAGNNASGDGPGYGQRFDSNLDCGAPPADGGVPDGGDDAGVDGGDDAGVDGGGDGGLDGGDDAGIDGGCDHEDSDGDCDDDSDSDSDSHCDDDSDGDSDCGHDDRDCKDCACDDDDCNGCDLSALDCCERGPVGEIAVEFECHEVHITSCKELSNVVLEFDDGKHYKFDNLKGHCVTLGVGDRNIVGVWVKAGNNASGDGPGYGQRFDSGLDCEPPPEDDAGVPDGGEVDAGDDAGLPDGGQDDSGVSVD